MSKKSYLYETVVDNKTRITPIGFNFCFSKMNLFSKIKNFFCLHKTFFGVVLSGFFLALVFLVSWGFVFVLAISVFLTVLSFSEDYKLFKIKKDFEENGIF